MRHKRWIRSAQRGNVAICDAMSAAKIIRSRLTRGRACIVNSELIRSRSGTQRAIDELVVYHVDLRLFMNVVVVNCRSVASAPCGDSKLNRLVRLAAKSQQSNTVKQPIAVTPHVMFRQSVSSDVSQWQDDSARACRVHQTSMLVRFIGMQVPGEYATLSYLGICISR